MEKNLKTIKTGDDSVTLYSQSYDEAYHSVNGAIKESFDKYAVPCKVAELAKRGSVNILDIGFGLGYNLLAAIYTAREANISCKVHIVSIEKELLDIPLLDSLPIPNEYEIYYEIVKSAAQELRYGKDGLTITILNCDARQGIKTLDGNFDAVFLDPFSVKKNPDMWTVNFFIELYKRMTDTAILATYSASTPVRCGFMEAGFIIGPGPSDGMKRAGTVATKCAIIPPFSKKETEKFSHSPERKPFYDPNLNSTKEEILGNRK